MSLTEQLQKKINGKTKPLGALGMLEQIALQAGLVQQTLSPQIVQPHIVVFAGDHGIAAAGQVNPYPQSVTAQMLLNFVHGGAAINVFCRQINIGLTVVDAGVNADFEEQLPVVHAKIRKATNNYSEDPAMSEDEAREAITKGRAIVAKIASGGCNCIGFGEMGIGNTSSASLIMSAVLELPVEDCVGRGTGSNKEQLAQKTTILQQVHQFHQLHLMGEQPLSILSRVGGFEIAMMVGAYLEAAEQHMLIVVDGFIATAALLIARLMQPAISANCIFAHCSGEQGHQKMLNYLQVQPLLQLGMRLGEGTGAALAIPLVQNAVAFLNQMASFESAGVTNKLNR
jgi:nicotinate-nucleotide--dimethylbenzimidazole phosphoribosyltransferase